MPYDIRKLPGKNKYRVRNRETGEILAKETSKRNAERQVRLLYMIEKSKKK